MLKFKVSKGDNTRAFCLDEKLTMGESDFNQFVQLRNQLVILLENFGGEQILSPIQIPKCPKRGKINWKWLAGPLTLWIVRTERCAWLRCFTMCTSQRVHVVKFDYLPGQKRTRSFTKTFMWFIYLKNFSTYLMFWILYMMKVLLWNPLLKKVFSVIYCWSFFFLFESRWVGALEKIETPFSS